MNLENIKMNTSEFVKNMKTKFANIKESKTYKTLIDKSIDILKLVKDKLTDESFGKSTVLNFAAATMFTKFSKLFSNCKWFKNPNNNSKIRKAFYAILKVFCTIGATAFAVYAIKVVISMIPTIITFAATIFGATLVLELIFRMLKIAMCN